MKNLQKLVFLSFIGISILISSCSKDNATSFDEDDMLKSATLEEAEIVLGGGGNFKKVWGHLLDDIRTYFYFTA